MSRRTVASRAGGFSLIEMTITIAVTGLLAVGLANLLRHPLEARAAVDRRADLVALADVALGRVVEDIEAAVPRSIRVSGGGSALELMRTIESGPYRAAGGINDPDGPAEADHSEDADWLTFSEDTSFNVLGRLANRPGPYGAFFAGGTRLAVAPDNAATLWRDAARDRNPGVITPSTHRISILDDGDEDQLQWSTGHTFPSASPTARFHLVEGPVTHVCDARDTSLWRIDRYPMARRQPTERRRAPLAGGNAARAADHVERCVFGYVAGPIDRGGLVTIELVLESGGERIRLMRQVQVRDAP